MNWTAVVALVVIVEDGLPVRVDDAISNIVCDAQFFQSIFSEFFFEVPQVTCEWRRFRVQIYAQKTAPALEFDRVQREVLPVELRKVIYVRDTRQTPIEFVGPGVVWASQDLVVAFSSQDFGPTMPADIVEGPDLVV